jgi:hypothetical protein
METYRFFIDRKVTVWVREYHEVESDSEENAKKEMIGAFHDNMCVDTFDEQEYMFDTEEYLEPGDNSGNSTAELYYDENSELLTTNLDLADSK